MKDALEVTMSETNLDTYQVQDGGVLLTFNRRLWANSPLYSVGRGRIRSI
jgi:hypothetical protein